MKIKINDKKTIQSIQDEFNTIFPYLKLEFFSKQHHEGEGIPKRYMKKSDRTLYECRTRHINGELEIVPEMTVAELEENFSNTYGLSAQVFRKSGKVWLETVSTDGRTLKD